MKVHYPKFYNMAHLLALYFYCFQRIYNYFIPYITIQVSNKGLHVLVVSAKICVVASDTISVSPDSH